MNEQINPAVYHGMESKVYHTAKGVSNSALKLLDRTPAHFKAAMEEPFEVTPALILGSLTHSFVLEPEKPLPNLAIKPEDMKFNTKEGKQWKVEREAEGKTIITTEAANSLVGMARSIASHPVAGPIIKNSETELSLFARNPRFEDVFGDDNPLLKCRIDIVPQGNFLADVKTCEDAGPEFSKNIFTYGYYQQAAFYLDLWNLLHPHDIKSHFIFIAVEKDPPYAVRVVKLSQEAIKAGRGLYFQRLSTYVECTRSGVWPAYPPEITEIDLPSWAYKTLERSAT